ncbi:MAG TPA: MFS transporter [Candidatus Saccharimonadia bacterium]|nr:MFS transporter [Candidatus Saccharimonadia bacterium]
MSTKQQRLVLIVSILASFVAFLDGSVVNVALPAISRELGGGLATQQWVVDGYLITLGALILIAGSLSDLFGRKRVLTVGLAGFGVASVLCAVAQDGVFLIAARALQGVAGALLVPSSLALIISSFKGTAQSKAIGSWTAWTGISFIIGPLVGGFLVDVASWRWVFAINVLPIAITLWLLALLEFPEQTRESTKIDLAGTLWCVLGLGGPVFALIEWPKYQLSESIIWLPLVAGLLALGIFFWHEARTARPMLSLSLFKVRNFSFGNAATAAIYAGLSISSFIIVIFLQQAEGYTAFAAGLALLPITAVMFVLSPRFGALAGKYGSRPFMTAGPLVSAVGFLLMLQVQPHMHYWTELFPGVMVFALGLSMTVAPLTSAVLGDIDEHQAGVASAVNNAVSRVAGLIAIALAGVISGPHLTLMGFHRVLWVIVGLMISGGVVSYIGIRRPKTAIA